MTQKIEYHEQFFLTFCQKYDKIKKEQTLQCLLFQKVYLNVKFGRCTFGLLFLNYSTSSVKSQVPIKLRLHLQ